MAGMYGCFKGSTSDSAAMASGPPDVMANQEPAEVGEECQGKKKSKFQTFKKFFTRKKRKEPPSAGADDGLKASQSSDDVSKTTENNKLTRSEKEKGSGSKINLGSKALSHDSVFVSDSSDANEALGASQDSIHGKVKSLQLQLKQAIRLGSPPSLMCVKRTEDAGTMSEDDGLPCSPPEYTTARTSVNKAQRNSGISLEGMDSDDDQLSGAASSRAVSPLVVPGDFSQPASPFGCLDNSAARHKLGLRYKACNKRKPVSRLEMKPETDSVAESTLNTSETDALEEQQKTEVVSEDELKPKVEKEEEEKKQDKKEEEEKEEEEKEEDQQPQHPRESLLRDKEEGDEESQAEQDVIRSPDSSSPPEPCLSEEEAPDAQSPPSPKPRSRASSVGSPRATPEPPASPEEYVLDPPAIAHGAEENRNERDIGEETKGEENEMQEYREEEGSLLQEVLSSLKAPIVSSSLVVEAEAAVQEIEEEVMEKESEVMEVEEEKEEEAEVGEPVSYQAAPADSLQTEEEEEGIGGLCISTPSCQDVEKEEEVKNEEEEASTQEEELVVEHVTEHNQKEGEKVEAEEVEPEELNDSPAGNAVNQAEEDGKIEEESEVEEEAMEPEKEPEVEEEGKQGKREEDDEEVEEPKERVEETEEVTERERDDAEEMKEVLPGAADEEDEALEVDEGVDVGAGDEAPQSADDDDEVSAELGEAVLVPVHESQEASGQSFGEEREDGEEELEEDVAIGHSSDQEKDDEANQPDADQTEEDEEQGGEETSNSDVRQEERDQTEATEQDSSKPPPLSLPDSHEAQTQESGTITPSKPSTTTLHINLVSPGSEKGASFFQQSPADAHPEDGGIPSPALSAAEQITASTEEDAAGVEERVEEETQSGLEDTAGIEERVEEEKQSGLEDAAGIEERVEEEKQSGLEDAAGIEERVEEENQSGLEDAAGIGERVEEEKQSGLEDAAGIEERVEKEEEKQSALEDEAAPPAAAEETVDQPSSHPDQSKVRFGIAPAWQRSLSAEEAKESSAPPSSPPACVTSPPACVTSSPACVSSPPLPTTGLGGEDVAEQRDSEGKAEPASSPVVELVLSPGRARNGGTAGVKSQSSAPSTTSAPSLLKAQTPPAAPADAKDAGHVKEGAVAVEGNPNNPFGVRLRKTSVLRRFSLEEENPEPPMEPPAQPSSCKVDSPQPISVKPSINQPISSKPALPKKPDLHGDGSGKTKRISEAPAAGGASDGSDPPSWISVAKQKRRIYKESSPEEINIKKEEQEKKSMYVSSAVCREHSSKPAESTSKGIPVEISKHSATGEKENRRVLSPPAPVPLQPPKSQTLPSHVSPKPYVPPGTAKHVPHPNAPQRSLSHPTPVPVAQRSLSCTSPPSPSKVATSSKTPRPQSTTVTSTPFSSKAAPEKFASKAPGLTSQTPSSQRGLSPPASPQDEPPWMALAKKKAKAWSEMPQIVQ